MVDEACRRLERESNANPDDRELVERAIRAHIRAGEPAALSLLDRWLRPDVERFEREFRAGEGACDGPTARALLKADPVRQVAFLGFAFARLDLFLGCRAVTALLSRLLSRTTLPISSPDLERIIEGAQTSGGVRWPQPWSGILRQCELCIEREGVQPGLRRALLGLRDARVQAFRGAREQGAVVTQARRLISAGAAPVSAALIQPGEAWANTALAFLGSLDAEAKAAWTAVLEHAATSKSGQPSKRWLATADERIASVGDAFLQVAGGWFHDRVELIPDRLDEFGEAGFDFVAPANLPVLRGLAWSLGRCGPAAVSSLEAVAAYCYRKVPGRGPRSAPLANACVTGLSFVGAEALTALERLREGAVHKSSRTMIERAMTRARGDEPTKAKRAKRAKPKPKLSSVAPLPYDQIERDRELVQELASLGGWRVMERMFVEDLERRVVSMKRVLSDGQREKARTMLEARNHTDA